MKFKFFLQVNGERNPEEVYKDFRAAILQILGTHDDQAAINGVGVGTGGIPGEIVGVEPAPVRSEPVDEETMLPAPTTVLPVATSVLPVAVAAITAPVQHENGHAERMVTPKVSIHGKRCH